MCLRAISAISWNTCKMQIVFAGILSLTDCTDVCGTFIGVASGVKRTSPEAVGMSANDPKRTSPCDDARFKMLPS